MEDFISLVSVYEDQIKNFVNFKKYHQELCEFKGNTSAKIAIETKILTWLYLKKNQRINSIPKHIVINGAPGCGKTTFAKIIGNLISSLGILKSPSFSLDMEKINKNYLDECITKLFRAHTEVDNLKYHVKRRQIKKLKELTSPPIYNLYYKNRKTFNKVSRKDLVGGFIGQTAIKTGKVIDESLGGVLFIDEAYNLCNRPDSPDGFDLECLTELNEAMTEKADDLIVILAGYKNLIQSTIMKVQPGLERRICLTLDLDSYTAQDLYQIFLKQIKSMTGWEVQESQSLFKLENFPYFGGDTERLAALVQDVCCVRFARETDSPHLVTTSDLKIALKDLPQKEKPFIPHMYT